MLTRHLATIAALIAAASGAAAQSAAATAEQHVAEGDSAYVAMNAPVALKHYQAALAIDSNYYPALWKASREAVSLGEFEIDTTSQRLLYMMGEAYGRRAVAVDAKDTNGWFVLARAIGRNSLRLGKKERVKFAKEIREDALTSLKYDSLNAGALHVMGRWNAEIMRLSGLSRFFAENFLGGEVFHAASWDSAVVYMQKAVKLDPDRLVHHLDLGEIYYDRNRGDDRALARTELELVVNGKNTEYNDPNYKKEASAFLAKMKK
jgi:tetratricopeptide (TPR) repeat protein